MASPLLETWCYATVLLENEDRETGTGFLVSRKIDEASGKVFLVTNKHVIHKNPVRRAAARQVILHLNSKAAGGTITGFSVAWPLSYRNGSKAYREHPDRDTDVLAVDVTDLIASRSNLNAKWADYTSFGLPEKLAELEITQGEEVIAIGYPLGLHHPTSNLPLLRQGIIATRIGECLQDEIKEEDGTHRKRTLQAFLIDGATIPGSSGSPVVLKPVVGRFTKGMNVRLGACPPILLGIIAETRYAPIHVAEDVILSFAGLGLAFDASTVRDTVELFFS